LGLVPGSAGKSNLIVGNVPSNLIVYILLRNAGKHLKEVE
jgi:hypothetical protein